MQKAAIIAALPSLARLALLALCLGVGACTPHYKVRYRISLELERGGQSIAASSIQESETWSQGWWNIDQPHMLSEVVRGDPIVFKFPDVDIIATKRCWRRHDESIFISYESCSFFKPILQELGLTGDWLWQKDSNPSLAELSHRAVSSPVALPPADLPVFAILDRRNDPTSLRVVDGAARQNQDFRVVKATVEIAQAAINHSAADQLPWLTPWAVRYFGPRVLIVSSSPSAILGPSAFGCARVRKRPWYDAQSIPRCE